MSNQSEQGVDEITPYHVGVKALHTAGNILPNSHVEGTRPGPGESQPPSTIQHHPLIRSPPGNNEDNPYFSPTAIPQRCGVFRPAQQMSTAPSRPHRQDSRLRMWYDPEHTHMVSAAPNPCKNKNPFRTAPQFGASPKRSSSVIRRIPSGSLRKCSWNMDEFMYPSTESSSL